MSIPTGVSTGTHIFVAERKLPDNLTLREYTWLVRAVSAVCFVGTRQVRLNIRLEPPARRTHPPQILRSQYGSDFVMAIGVSTGILAILSGAAMVVRSLSVAAKNGAEAERILAEARKTNAEATLLELQAASQRELIIREDTKLKSAEAWIANQLLTNQQITDSATQTFVAELGSLARQDRPPLRKSKHEPHRSDAIALVHAVQLLARYDINLSIDE